VFPGAGSARNGSASQDSSGEFDVGFDGRVSTGIKDLTGTDGGNGSC